MKKLLPVVLALIGLAAGAGAGFYLRPALPPAAAGPKAAAEAPKGGHDGHASAASSEALPAGATGAESGTGAGNASGADAANTDYVKLDNQFIVPIVKTGKVRSLVILSLSIAVATGTQSKVYDAEPKLRDAFLQVLFDHANSGGFDGNFTLETKMAALRSALREVAVKILGDSVRGVLISDLVRQDA